MPLIIDCDTGRDDALALWVTLISGLPLVGVVTSYGNTNLTNVTENTNRVLSLAGREDIPIFPGATTPLEKHKGFEDVVLPRQEAAGNGLCNLELPPSSRALPATLSPEEMLEAITTLFNKHGPLDYVIIGPATNFAALCRSASAEICRLIKHVTMMGGKLSPLWEKMPDADFNIAADPLAVQTILKSSVNIRFIPINITWPLALSLEKVETLETSSEIGKISKELMISHCLHFSPEPVFRFHDPVAILASQCDFGFKTKNIDIICDESEENYGRLIEKENSYKVGIYDANEQQNMNFLNNILNILGLSFLEESRALASKTG